MIIVKGFPQTVFYHTVNYPAIVHSISVASPFQDIGGIAHVLHTAGQDNISVTGFYYLSCQAYGSQA